MENYRKTYPFSRCSGLTCLKKENCQRYTQIAVDYQVKAFPLTGPWQAFKLCKTNDYLFQIKLS